MQSDRTQPSAVAANLLEPFASSCQIKALAHLSIDKSWTAIYIRSKVFAKFNSRVAIKACLKLKLTGLIDIK